MRFPTLVLAALILVTPAAALAQSAHDRHGTAAPGARAVPHSRQVVQAGGLKATFHFNAPNHAIYTCPMHPEVTAEKPGICPKCNMKLTKQTHRITLQLVDERQKAVKGALVRLVIKDAYGMSQGLTFKGDGNDEGAFALTPGKQDVTAFVKRAGDAPVIALQTTYVVR